MSNSNSLPAGMKVAGGVLAGGASRRFGEDKAKALLAGQSMRDHVAANLLAAGCHPVLESSNAADRPNALRDQRDDSGPLAGVEALLLHLQQQGQAWLLTCPVDIPVLPTDFGPRMIKAALENPDRICMAAPEGLDAWLCAIWPVSCLQRLSTWLDAGERRVRPFLEKQQSVAVSFPAPSGQSANFINVNHREELETVAKFIADARLTT